MDVQASHDLDLFVNHPAMENVHTREEPGYKPIPHTYILVRFSLAGRVMGEKETRKEKDIRKRHKTPIKIIARCCCLRW
jgi:hypothetical protein